jgi:hypothetical protein
MTWNVEFKYMGKEQYIEDVWEKEIKLKRKFCQVVKDQNTKLKGLNFIEEVNYEEFSEWWLH